MRTFLIACIGVLVSTICYGNDFRFQQARAPWFDPCYCKQPIDDSTLAGRADQLLQKGSIGLSKNQLIEAFRCIEKGDDSYKKVRLPCVIEKTKHTNRYIIRDFHGKGAYIGRGCHKVVKKAVLYGSQTKVIADCISDDSARGEIFILKKLKGIEGIVKFYGSRKRGKKYSIYLEYFSQGALASKLNNKEPLGDHVYKIAYDVAKGLRGMHERKFVHRDLHSGNILIELSDTFAKAVLVDFGKTLPIARATTVLPQIPKSKTPPETLIRSFRKINKYAADVYALGCIFFHMTTGQTNPWSDVYNVYRLKKYSSAKKKEFYKKIVDSYLQTKKALIGDILIKQSEGAALSRQEKLMLLVFAMIDFEPTRRPSIDAVVSSLSELQ